MKKIILSLLLLCSLATYADTYYSQSSEMWDPWMDEWASLRYKTVKIEVTDNNQIIIYDDYTLKFNVVITNGTRYTDNGTPYLDYVATMESEYFNVAIVIYNSKQMDIVIFKQHTDEGLVYHINM